MKFNKSDLIELADGVSEVNNLVLIQDNLIDKKRWTIVKELVFRDLTSNRIFGVEYEIGATENQPYGPFEFEEDMVECAEYRAVEVRTVRYEPL